MITAELQLLVFRCIGVTQLDVIKYTVYFQTHE